MIAGLVLVGLGGLAVGSFLTVVIHRVPRGEPLLTPRSYCPRCDTPIRWWHTVPLLGWLVLRGRCAACGAAIGRQYPLVEVVTALLLVAVTVRLQDLRLLAAVPAFLYVTAVGVALAVIDLQTRRLPNALVLPSYPVLAGLLAVAAAWQGDWWAFARAVIGGAVLFAFFFAVAFLNPAGMGFGDVKLAGLLGAVLAYLSWPALAVGAFAGLLLGAIVGVALLASGRCGRTTALPFGPFLAAGALLGLFVAEPVAAWYATLLT